jgi:hypothetical protein
MGSSTISAVLDRNVIYSKYVRKFTQGDDPEPVDLAVRVIHTYYNSNNQLREIELENLVIPALSLQQKGNLDHSTYTQEVELRIVNLRYVSDLFLELQELRNSQLLTKKIQVLNGVDSAIRELPTNPIKEPQHPENQPPQVFVPPANVYTPEPINTPILYVLKNDGLEDIQTSRRVFLDNNIFVEQNYADTPKRVFIENASTNLLPNVGWALITDRVPTDYEISAPGINLNSYVEPGDIPGTNVWRIRASNPNVFSAFSTVELRTVDLQDLPLGSPYLSSSVYYRVTSQLGITPFNTINFSITFYDSSEVPLTTVNDSIPVAEEGPQWNLVYTSLNSGQIPLSAALYSFSLEIAGIDRTENFDVQFYLPQLEVSPFPTSRILSPRVQDSYRTVRDIRIENPFYLSVRAATHSPDATVKGLADTTHLLESGFQFFTSNNTLTLKQYDTNGFLLFSVTSFSLGGISGAVEYGVYADGSKIDFYKNGTLVSSHSQPHVIALLKKMIVGSLENPNSTINCEILDFRVTKLEPI